jgi:predicted Zn-dependent peptidase
VFAQHGQHLDTGSMFAQAGVDTSRAEEAMSTIAGELRRIADAPVPAEELDKTKSYLRGRLVLGLEDPRSVVAFGLRGEVLEGQARELPEILAGIDAVTAEDVQRLARELFAPEELKLATVGPFDDVDRARSLLTASA